MRATSHNVLWGLLCPYGPFFGFCFSSHTRNNYVIVVWKSLKLPQSPSKGNRGKERQKGTENKEVKIEGVNENKRTERKRHTETEYAPLLIGSKAVMPGEFNFLYVTCSFLLQTKLVLHERRPRTHKDTLTHVLHLRKNITLNEITRFILFIQIYFIFQHKNK